MLLGLIIQFKERFNKMSDLKVIEGAYYPTVEFGIVGPMEKHKHTFYVWSGFDELGRKHIYTNRGWFRMGGPDKDSDLDLTKPMRKDGTPWFQNDEIDDSIYQQYKHLKLKPGHKWVLVRQCHENIWNTRIFTGIGNDRNNYYYCVIDHQMSKYEIPNHSCNSTFWQYMKEFNPKEENSIKIDENISTQDLAKLVWEFKKIFEEYQSKKEDKMVNIQLSEDEVRKISEFSASQHNTDWCTLSKVIIACKEWVEKNPIKKKIPWTLEEKVKWCLENKDLYVIFYTKFDELSCKVNNVKLCDIENAISFRRINSTETIVFEKEID